MICTFLLVTGKHTGMMNSFHQNVRGTVFGVNHYNKQK